MKVKTNYLCLIPNDKKQFFVREEEENNPPEMKKLFFLYVWLNLTRIPIPLYSPV